MRLIDADALKKEWSMGLGSCDDCPQNTRRCQLDMDFTRMDICGMIDDAPTVGGWISVKDRLPEDDREVLAAYKITEKGIKWWGVETASCIAGNGEVDWVSLWDEYRIPNGSKRVITHWMPLPEPPKEESND